MIKYIKSAIKKTCCLLAFSLFLITMETGASHANDKVKLILDWFVNPNHGPIIIAQENGYFQEYNLDVEIIAPADPSDPPKLVAAGGADIAISYQPDLHLQIDAGLPLTRVGTLIATPLNCLLVRDDGPVKKIQDLKGRKIGYSVAGVEEALLKAMLKKANLGLKDVELVNVNWSLSPSLMSGQVDAVIGAYRNFELNQMDIEGVKGRCLYIEEEGIPPYDELVFIANANKMNKDVLNRFLMAIEKAVAFIINSPDDSFNIFAATATELQDELNKRAWFDTYPRFATRPHAYHRGRYNNFEKFLHENGLIETIHPIEMLAVDISD